MSRISPNKRQPYMAGCRGFGMGMRASRKYLQATQLLAAGTSLLRLPQTFSRATSAYDPIANKIVAPGVLRTRSVGLVPTLSDALALVEGPRTNLLAAGLSEHWDLWNPGSAGGATPVFGSVAPDGSLTGCAVTVAASGGDKRTQNNFVVANDNSVYCFSVHVPVTTGTPAFYPALLLELTGGSTQVFNTVAINTTAGTVISSGGTTTITRAGSFWRVSITCTNNTTGNTTLACLFYPTFNTDATLTKNCQAGTGIGAWASVEQAAFPSSFISNRNLHLFSQLLSNAAWAKTAITATDASATGPDGKLSLDKLAETAATSTHNLAVGATTVGTGAVTFSAYASAAERTFIALYFGTAGKGKFFNLSNGTIGGNLVAAPDNATIAAVPGFPGLYRCSITLNTTVAGNQAPTVYLSNDGSTISYLGVLGSGANVGCTQTEYGTVATTYWGTNATVGGRDADNLSVSLAGITDTRTNYLTFSEQADNAAWTAVTGGTGVARVVTPNFANDPNGNPYADRIQLDQGAGVTSADFSGYQQSAQPFSNPHAAVLSIWMKSNSGGPYTVALRDATTNTIQLCTVTTTWQRFTCFAPNFASAINVFQIILRGTYGTSTTADILVWGHQAINGTVDAGQAGYLPTGAAVVTATQTGLSTTTGTLVALGVPYGRGTSAVSAKLYQTSVSSGSAALFDPTGSSYRDIYSPFSSQAETNGALSVYASTWNPSVDLTYAGGAQIATVPTTATTAPYTLATSMAVGSGIAVAAQYYGWVWLGYWHNRALSASEVLAIHTALKGN